MDVQTFDLLRQWDKAGSLPLRVYAMAVGTGQAAKTYLARGPFKGDRLTMRAVKFYVDGALGSRGAALHAPYSDEKSHSGLLLMTASQLEEAARRFMEAGFQVAVHAIGDRANSTVIKVLPRAAVTAGAVDGRHRVEHAQIVRPEDVKVFAESRLIASMQPTHATSDMPWVPERLGKDRSNGAYAWRTLLEAGVPLAFGSDFPIEDANPLWGLYAARTRQDHQGKPAGGWMRHEALDGSSALRAFTEGAAYAAFAEAQRGALRPGMAADWVALSVDPVQDAPPALLTGKALLTVVGGQEVYRAP
jgi:predicted amidohydrolase YtcJ